MRQMTAKFIKNYPIHKPKIQLIIQNLRRVTFVPNIENILSYARGCVSPKVALLNSSPFTACLASSNQIKKLGYDPSMKVIIRDIEEFISEEWCIQDNRISLAEEHYATFFEHIRKQLGLGRLGKNKLAQIDIFTTNYDNLIELYAYDKHIELFNGYAPLGDNTVKFSPELFGQFPINLYKLHGSVTLGRIFHIKSGQKAIAELMRGVQIGEIYKKDWSVVDRVMIHGYEKDPSQEPYFDLLYRLKAKLFNARNVLVVGYSFSDKPVLNIFRYILSEKDDNFRLVILDKNASRIKTKLFSNDRRIRCISKSFCDFKVIRHGRHFI